jgi:sugar-specific transcriptional regulator TrmB
MSIKIQKILKELGFGDSEVEVYVALTELGEAPAAELSKKVGLPRTTVISILERLEEKNFLTTQKYKGKIYYWVESPRVISDIFQNKAQLAGDLEGLLSSLYKEGGKFPFAKTYDTKNGIRNFAEGLLLKARKKSILYTIDTPQEGNYRKVFSDELERIFFGIKKKRQLFTKILIPHGSFSQVAQSKISSQDLEIRELPPGVKFEASVWLIDDFACFFSGNPPFLSAINHRSIKDGLQGLYDFLWSSSSKMN